MLVWYVHSSLLVCSQGLPKQMGLESLSDVVFDGFEMRCNLFKDRFYIYTKKQEMKINNVSLWFFKHICFEHHWTLCLMSRNLIWYVLGPQNIYFTYPQVLFVWRNCALTIGCFGTGSWVFMCRFFSWSSCARRWFNWKHWTGEVISEINIFVFDYV